MDAEVLYFQMTCKFPSWTSWVRIPSPAPFRINHLQRLAGAPTGAFLLPAERQVCKALIPCKLRKALESQTE